MSLERQTAHYDRLSHLSEPLLVPLASRKYNRQFSTLYDYRLRRLKHPKGRLVKMATEQWTEGKGTSKHLSLGSSDGKDRMKANYIKRILDVKQGQICFVIGTIYCSMHLKPDVLEELTREVSFHIQKHRTKLCWIVFSTSIPYSNICRHNLLVKSMWIRKRTSISSKTRAVEFD